MSQIVFEALEYAARCHHGTYRKGTSIPYIVHPTSMVRYLARLDAPDALCAAAALHDVVEDTEATLEEIRERFGGRVAELVRGASEADKGLSWRERKEATIRHIRETDDTELLVLACVDKLDNLGDVREDLTLRGESIWDRFRADKLSQAWYYRSLAEIFSEKLSGTPYSALAHELSTLCLSIFGV